MWQPLLSGFLVLPERAGVLWLQHRDICVILDQGNLVFNHNETVWRQTNRCDSWWTYGTRLKSLIKAATLMLAHGHCQVNIFFSLSHDHLLINCIKSSEIIGGTCKDTWKSCLKIVFETGSHLVRGWPQTCWAVKNDCELWWSCLCPTTPGTVGVCCHGQFSEILQPNPGLWAH